MADGVAFADMADFLNGTFEHVEVGSIIQAAQTYQDYPFVRMFFDEKKMVIRGGKTIDDNVKRTKTGNARHVKPYQKGTIAQQDNTVRQSLQWRRTQVSSVWDEYIDLMNQSDEEVFSLAVERDMDMDLDMAELIETTIWGKPADSTDDVTPYGVQMFIVPNATQGFNGGNPSGFSSGVGGIDRTLAANANLLNWTDTFADYGFGDGDVFAAMQTMADKTGFRPPMPTTASKGFDDEVPQRGFFTTYTGFSSCRNALRKQNENLGSDADPFAEGAYFRKTRIMWAPPLDDIDYQGATNPLVQIDWRCFYPVAFNGAVFRRHPARHHPEQPNTLVVFKDLQWNTVGKNCRRCGIIYQV